VKDVERLQVVAHELRSPVAALAALADAFPGAPTAARPRLVELAVAAGRDIERLLSDPELFSLRRELVDVGAVVSSFADDGKVTVTVFGSPRAHADPTRLRQAIGNVVTNALRHGGQVTIQVGEGQDTVVVDVVDDGPGVDPGIDPFARGTSGSGSTGLGLWLARAIAEAHGGTLRLLPGPDTGARFRLVLPSASAAR
jgi:two-component system sensor histidine kinase BaeS